MLTVIVLAISLFFLYQKKKKRKKKLVNCVISGKAFPNGPNPINISKPLQFIFEKK